MTRNVANNTIDSRLNQVLSPVVREGGDRFPTSSMMGAIAGATIGKGGVDNAGNIIVQITADEEIQVWYNFLSLSENDVFDIAMSVLESGKSSGNIGVYYFKQATTQNNTFFAITDATQELVVISRMRQTSYVIFGISLLIVFAVAWLLSRWAIKPIESAMEKQKQFISDASHELKTPLSVISINSEIIKRETNENVWCDAIISETTRMNELVNDMLSLSQLDEGCHFEKLPFNMSETITNVALLFEVFAYEKGRELGYEIDENIEMIGVESKIKQLAIILIENAVKNSFENSKINLKLQKTNTHIILQVENIGETIEKEIQTHIFERFYRVDNSRNTETGGFGLGLCIAKSIVDLHKGKITVASENEKTCFTVIFKCDKQ